MHRSMPQGHSSSDRDPPAPAICKQTSADYRQQFGPSVAADCTGAHSACAQQQTDLVGTSVHAHASTWQAHDQRALNQALTRLPAAGTFGFASGKPVAISAAARARAHSILQDVHCADESPPCLGSSQAEQEPAQANADTDRREGTSHLHDRAADCDNSRSHMSERVATTFMTGRRQPLAVSKQAMQKAVALLAAEAGDAGCTSLGSAALPQPQAGPGQAMPRRLCTNHAQQPVLPELGRKGPITASWHAETAGCTAQRGFENHNLWCAVGNVALAAQPGSMEGEYGMQKAPADEETQDLETAGDQAQDVRIGGMGRQQPSGQHPAPVEAEAQGAKRRSPAEPQPAPAKRRCVDSTSNLLSTEDIDKALGEAHAWSSSGQPRRHT